MTEKGPDRVTGAPLPWCERPGFGLPCAESARVAPGHAPLGRGTRRRTEVAMPQNPWREPQKAAKQGDSCGLAGSDPTGMMTGRI